MCEFITIQVGQCGNQIGSAFWPLALEEYGISTNSSYSSLLPFNQQTKLDYSFKSFFNCPVGVPKVCKNAIDLSKYKITARTLLIDMEERVVERFHHGTLRKLFDSKCSLTNHPGSGNNWAVGHFTHFLSHRSQLEDMIRRSVEQCDSLHGFLLMFSLSGGTGAGLGTALVHFLAQEYPHVQRLVTCVHPGKMTDVITSPYNIGHSLRVLSENASCVIPVDNQALGDICNRHSLNRGVKPFQDSNNIVVNMLLHLTSGSRFPGSLNCDLSDLSSLAPQPGLQYLSASYSPVELYPQKDVSFANKQRNLVQEVCSREDQLLKINAFSGTILTAALLCRGSVSLSTLREYVSRFRAKVKFARWADPGIKTGLCSVPPLRHKSGMLCLLNSTNMEHLFSDSLKHFDRLYKRKAHIHHYTNVDGFEENGFLLTKESLLQSAEKYMSAGNFVEIPRLQVSL